MDRRPSGGDLRHSGDEQCSTLEDNMRGGVGESPTQKLRQRMIEALAKL